MVDAFGPYAEAALRDAPDPVPGEGEVVVAVKAVDLNFPDILVMEGKYQVRPPLPFSPGKAGAGVVEAVGPKVDGLKPGMAVAFQVEYGAYAEKVLARADTCYPMPDGMPSDEAAALGLVYQTAWFALHNRAGFQPGETVLVLGASGGIGVAAIQLAKALGARHVIGCVSKPESAPVAEQAGADTVICTAMDNLRDGLRDAVRTATGGHGADIVIDAVGGEAHAAAIRAMAWEGRMVIVGFASGDIPAIRSNYLLVKNIAVSGLQWSDYRERDPAGVARAQAELFRLWSQGALRPIISDRLALGDFAAGLKRLTEGKARGKIILTTGEA